MLSRRARPGQCLIAIALLAACQRGSRSDKPSDPAASGLGIADGAAALPGEPVPLARIERTACRGRCPVYRIEVWDDGAVTYEGRAHVKVVGRAEARLAKPDLARLRSAFEAARFTTMQAPPLVIIDLPTTILGYRNGAQLHLLQYLRATPETQRLEEELETIVGASRWVGTEADRAPSE